MFPPGTLGVLLQSKDTQVRLTGDCKLPIDVNVCLNSCLFLWTDGRYSNMPHFILSAALLSSHGDKMRIKIRIRKICTEKRDKDEEKKDI